LLTLALSGCGGGTSTVSNAAAPGAASIGGTLSGLASGESVVMELNGGDPRTISANGTFTLSSSIAINGSYSVTVAAAPAGQTCTVAGGEGMVTSVAVDNIVVTCSDQAFSLGGTVSGLGARTGLILRNGADSRSVSANTTSFVMSTPVRFDSTYAVSLQSTPPGLECTISRGAGTMPAHSVSSVAVNCAAQDYTVGGSVSGLTSSGLVLANGSDRLTVAPNAVSFTMPTGVPGGSTYHVTAAVHPPATACSVSNGAGPVAAADIANVAVACTAGTESVLYSFVANGTDAAGPNHSSLLLGSDGNFYGMTYAGGSSSDGTVFMITPSGAETVLWSFGSGSDGSYPDASLVQAGDGNFYGTTSQGGTHGRGTVFRITPAGAETVLWSFGSVSDGYYPYGSLFQHSDGNFYGTTFQGGANNFGTVFRITPAGVETVLWSFGSGSDGSYPFTDLALGSDGNFYGTTSEGGTLNEGTIFVITPAGAETVLWSFGSGSDGFEPYGSLVLGSDGNFYGMTYEGGAHNEGTVFDISPAGVEALLWSFGGGTDGSYPEDGLVQGVDGNFYAVTHYGGANGDGAIVQITPSGTETVLWSFAGADGQYPGGELSVGPDGTLYGLTGSGGANGVGAVFAFN